MKRELKPKESDYDECSEHKQKTVLYCKDAECQKGMCQMCMSERHLTHQVVNILDKVKKNFFPKIDQLIQILNTSHHQILLTKQQIQHDLEEVVKQATNKRDELFKGLDEKMSGINDNIATLNDIKNKTSSDTTYNEFLNKIEFQGILDDLTRTSTQLMTYRSFKLVENKKELVLPSATPTKLDVPLTVLEKTDVSDLSVETGRTSENIFVVSGQILF